MNYEPIPDDEQAKEWDDRKITSAGKYEGDLDIKEAEALTGGTGFNDAVEITQGSYADKIVPGEYRFYKIPVEWGQRPVIKATTGASVLIDADSIGFGLHDPLRTDVARGSLGFVDEAVESDQTSPTEYAWYGENRQGYYFVWFGMGSKGEHEITGVEQPYEFVVALDGEPADGGMDWKPTYEDGPEPSDEPIKFDGAKSSTESTAREESSSATESSEQQDQPGQQEQAAQEDTSKSSWAVLGGLGLLLLAVIGAVIFLVRRNRA